MTRKICLECEYMLQASMSCVCGHPAQSNEDMKGYVSPMFHCGLFEEKSRRGTKYTNDYIDISKLPEKEQDYIFKKAFK